MTRPLQATGGHLVGEHNPAMPPVRTSPTASPGALLSAPPPPPSPSRGSIRSLFAKPWAVGAVAAVAFLVGAVVMGGLWSLGSGATADAPVGADGTARPTGQAQGQLNAPAAPAAGSAGGTSAVTQPSRDTVLQNLLSAQVPRDPRTSCAPLESSSVTLSNGRYQGTTPVNGVTPAIVLPWLDSQTGGAPSTPQGEVAWGDITGDGIDDIAVRVFCRDGRMGVPHSTVIYAVAANGSLTPLGIQDPRRFQGIGSYQTKSVRTYAPGYANGAFVLSGDVDSNPSHTGASVRHDTRYTATFTAPDGRTLTQTGLTSIRI